MIQGTLSVDVSEWQQPVADSYPHDWFSFRVCDGTYVDRNLTKNLAWAKRAAAAGQIAGYTAYCVFRPNTPTLQTFMREVGAPDPFMTAMVDVESWSGAIHGNQSQAITALANGFGEWLGDRRRVICYGNHADLEALYPVRPPWLRFVVASYGTQPPVFPNLIGWQYSDGDVRWPVPTGLPRASKPFGPCDHNIFPDLSAAELAAELGVGGDMPLSDQDIQKVAKAVTDEVWGRQFRIKGGLPYAASSWLVAGNDKAGRALTAAQQATAAAKQAVGAVQAVTVDAAAVAQQITDLVKSKIVSLFGGQS